MTVPKRRMSKMKGRTRRSHYHAVVPTLTKCRYCGHPHRPHAVCPNCNRYRGRSYEKPKTVAELSAATPDKG
jgi:large subunit ribosomal protein L32